MSRYGSKKYKRSWIPTPAQAKMARAMGILRDVDKGPKDGGFTQEDRLRVDHYLQESPFGKNSDYLTDANVQEQIQTFDRFKEYAVTYDIDWTGKDSGNFEVDGVTRSGWLTRPEDVSKIWKAIDTDYGGGRDAWLNPKTVDEVIADAPETTFWENQVPKTIEKEVTNTWGKVTGTEYTKDFSDDLTTEIVGERAEKWGLSAEQAQAIETSFIDELYGTTGADATTWGTSSYADEPGQDSTLRAWDVNESRMDKDGNWIPAKSDYDATWGLDLVRVYNEDLVAGTPAMTDHLTKGPISYAHYKNDPEYSKALQSLGYNLDQEGVTDARKAAMIREARQIINTDTGEGDAEVELTNEQLEGIAALGVPATALVKDTAEKKDGDKKKLYEEDSEGNLLEPKEWEGMHDPNKIYTHDGELYIDDIKQKRLKDRLKEGSARYDPTKDIASGAWDKLKIDPYVERSFSDLSSEKYRATLNLPSRESFGLKTSKPEPDVIYKRNMDPAKPGKSVPSWRDYSSTDTSKPGYYRKDSKGKVYKVLDAAAEKKYLAKNKSTTKSGGKT